MLMVWLPEADSLSSDIILTGDLFLRANLFGFIYNSACLSCRTGSKCYLESGKLNFNDTTEDTR